MTTQSSEESRKHEDFFGQYERLFTLGRGNFGKVYIARHCETNEQVAIKVIDKSAFRNNDQKQHSYNEKAICESLSMQLKHKNIVNVYRVEENDTHIHVVMEYVEGGELFDKIKQKRRLDETLARQWFREIIEAIGYVHKHGIVHRDLKPENVLIDKYQTVKLCDFGFGKFFERRQVLNTYCGSPFYAAPEMVTATPYQGPPVDMWSCGVILFAMLAGTLPFQGQDMPQLFRRINSGCYSVPDYISADAADLITRLLCKDPQNRITAEACLEHAWLREPHLPAATTLDTRSTTIATIAHLLISPLHSVRPYPSSTSPSSSSNSTYGPHHYNTKLSRTSRLFVRLFSKKSQVGPAPAANRGDCQEEPRSSKSSSSNNKIKVMERKVVFRIKRFLQSAFQRRLANAPQREMAR